MSKLNPQKASAYVGPGVLRKGGKITPVPNGPLVKKKGPFKGSTLKTGGIMKKAQTGGTYYATSKGRVGRLSGSTIGNTIVDARNESIDTTGYSKGKKEFKKIESSSAEGNTIKKVKRKDVPKVISELKKGATRKEDYRKPNQKKKSKMKAGGMIKRADGSYSKRGLWDNIRANKGSGKKPTAAMLKQERKIKAKTKK